jgi:organic radical activating enzyme
MSNYNQDADKAETQLNNISSSMCYAKWAQVSLHLTNGMTNSCYHPPLHKIDEQVIKFNPKALHNTEQKKLERKMMLEGKRPEGCSYCWKIEDRGDRSDRIYRSGEYWAQNARKDIIDVLDTGDINPRYVEVNFNQACNFKCMYCSPHLSTEWENEIKKYGPYDILDSSAKPSKHNDAIWLEKEGIMPIKVKQDDNPYLTAFWQWWPDLYKNLEVFRITGGEPLMDVNTFKVLDYIYENPNSDLELSITTNMCPPKQELMDKFIDKLVKLEEIQIWENKEKFNKGSGNHWYVNMALKNFSLFVSLDSVGEQAEYIRTGLNYEVMQNNVLNFLNSTCSSTVTFINTFNMLSVLKIKDFLEYILILRSQHSKENQGTKYIPIHDPYQKHPDYVLHPRQRIWFDLPLLRYPAWQSVELLPLGFEKYIEDAIKFMENNADTSDFVGFYDFEIDKLKRNLNAVLTSRGKPSIDLNVESINFVNYFNQYDARRGTSFKKTFPELISWHDSIDLNKSLNLPTVGPKLKKNTANTKQKIAVCLYGSQGANLIKIKEHFNEKLSQTFNIDYYAHFDDTDLYKNLWISNFKKRQVEIEDNFEYYACIAFDVSKDWDDTLLIPEENIENNTLYFLKGGMNDIQAATKIDLSIFFANSHIFDIVCSYELVRKSINLVNEEAFYYYLKTLKINTKCINYENSSLFKRPT